MRETGGQRIGPCRQRAGYGMDDEIGMAVSSPRNPRRALAARRARITGIGVCLTLGVSACAVFTPSPPPPAGIGNALEWRQVVGWQQDDHAEAWPALLRGCKALAAQADWYDVCQAARKRPDLATAAGADNNLRVRRFFERWFRPHQLHGGGGKTSGLITGYYEPLLFGSFTPSERYRYPLYAPPPTLLSIQLDAIYPELKHRPVRGRIQGRAVVPFYSRREIDSDPTLLAGNELLWIDDRDAVFFLHIQGSGRVQLPDGRRIGVGYANQNGRPYFAIGRALLARGELTRAEISLFTIRQWLRDNPQRAEELLFRNPSYVFFGLRDEPGMDGDDGPVGALNVPLTAQRSIAIDPEVVKLGVPMWLSTNFPGDPTRPYQRLVLAQDSGGAIKGALRADLFWGHGDDAERAAGIMQERGSLIVLLPKTGAGG